jgi:hypothetical protein
VDAPLSAHELIRPWRRATILASAVAALELVLLLGAGLMLVAKPLAHMLRRHAVAAAYAPAKKAAATAFVVPKPKPVGAPTLTRSHTAVLVLNGNGVNGAAGAEAAKLHALGYEIAGAVDARRQDYATTVVMYSPGFQPEAVRLAHDMHVQVVGPLDGFTRGALRGGRLAVILGR